MDTVPIEPVRILIGNEPRAYREVLAAALRELRPAAGVELVDPTALDAEVVARPPALIICSRLTAVIRNGPLTWVLLSPDGDGRDTIGTGDVGQDLPGADFWALVAMIDQALAPGDPAADH